MKFIKQCITPAVGFKLNTAHSAKFCEFLGANMQKILVSACLLGHRVRYDGNDMTAQSGWLECWQGEGRTIPFCPERAAGLPIPRPPAEIRGGDGDTVLSGDAMVTDREGADLTGRFIQGAEVALSICIEQGIHIAIMSESSPSCGSTTIYNGHFCGKKVPGAGVTTALLRRHDIHVFSQHTILSAAEYLAGMENIAPVE